MSPGTVAEVMEWTRGILLWSREPAVEVEPDLGAHAPPPQAAHSLDVVVLGVHA